jgi:hypothetical protein
MAHLLQTTARNTSTLASIWEPEAAAAVQKCSWWWAKCCPKHVEQRLNNERFYNWVCIWLVVLFEYLKMHGTTNHKLMTSFFFFKNRTFPLRWSVCMYQFVWKVSVLIFYLIIYWTYLKLQVISFKVWPLGSYTMVPAFLPLIIAVLEVIFCKCV